MEPAQIEPKNLAGEGWQNSAAGQITRHLRDAQKHLDAAAAMLERTAPDAPLPSRVRISATLIENLIGDVCQMA